MFHGIVPRASPVTRLYDSALPFQRQTIYRGAVASGVPGIYTLLEELNDKCATFSTIPSSNWLGLLHEELSIINQLLRSVSSRNIADQSGLNHRTSGQVP